MRKRTFGALAGGLAVALVGAVSALAGPLAGKTYEGSLPTEGTADYHNLRMRTHADGDSLVLTVSRNGRTVTARFSGAHPFMYCNNSEVIKESSTKPAAISRSGSFRAKIEQAFTTGGGEPALTQTISGRFSGRKVSGTISTSAGECGGKASFVAYAK